MKRVKVEGGEPRVERALKAEIHTEEYTVLGAIRTRHERLKGFLESWFHPFLPLEEAIVLHRDASGIINSFSWGTAVYRCHKAPSTNFLLSKGPDRVTPDCKSFCS